MWTPLPRQGWQMKPGGAPPSWLPPEMLFSKSRSVTEARTCPAQGQHTGELTTVMRGVLPSDAGLIPTEDGCANTPQPWRETQCSWQDCGHQRSTWGTSGGPGYREPLNVIKMPPKSAGDCSADGTRKCSATREKKIKLYLHTTPYSKF